ncbi:MAG: RluA family pseudouridine synthase [Erysipelotrichaceae bacterium]|nr:RluA family pseudouridine synthase [Erysipelotrichaceae bacterium]
MKELRVKKEEANQKIEKYVRKYFSTLSLSLIYKLFRKKDIKVNGKHVSKDYILQENDVVRVYVVEYKDEEHDFIKVPYKFDVVYEDENILVINKPVGVLVHEGEDGNDKNTLNKQVLSYLIDKGEYNPDDRGFIPSAAHRLDRNTGGIILYGKNIIALQNLFDLLKEHSNIEKYYLTLVNGKLDKKGNIDFRLKKDEKSKVVKVTKDGLEAHTLYKTIRSNSNYSLAEVQILTGRTHQIRVHMASIGHPILGDSKYGDSLVNKEVAKKYKIKNQFLYAYKFSFKEIKGYLSYLSGKTFQIELNKENKDIIEKIFS